MACVETTLENRISELPDDILVHVLSLLSLKEAGRTSILSKRWRHVWAYVPTLNFDNDKVLRDHIARVSNCLSVEEEEPKYVRWVDQVMRSHKAPTIDKFKVQFNLHSSRKDNVDNWVRFAMEKGVKKFQLHTEPIAGDDSLGSWGEEHLIYTFPSLSFNSLTYLELSALDVSSEVVEKLLRDCPIEYLSLFHPLFLEDLKVVGPLKLKTLKLHLLEDSDLEISAPNLTSFHFSGSPHNFLLKSNPKLTEISIRDYYGTQVLCDFSSLSRYASQIEALTLEAIFSICEHFRVAEAFPVCSRLKLLDVTIAPRYDDQLFGLLSLIKACPSLHKFVLQFESFYQEAERTAKTRNVEACPHHSLKIVEIKGFVGWEVDFGFTEYLIENAIALEKISIELVVYETNYEPCLEKRQTRARHQAEQLRAKLKPGTELQIHCYEDEIKYNLLV